MTATELLESVWEQIKDLNSAEYVYDSEGFIEDTCLAEKDINRVFETALLAAQDIDLRANIKEFETLSDEVLKMKIEQQSENRDYRVGFICACSNVEGLIAQKTKELNKAIK